MTSEEYDLFAKTILPNTYPGAVDMTHQWWCQQHPDEFKDMMLKVSAINPKRILEIGSAHGGCLPFYDQLAGRGGVVVGVDPDPGAFAAVDEQYSGYQSRGDIIRITGKSQDNIEAVECMFDYLPIDFVFIDGDHSYEGAKRDFDLYSPLVRSGGIIGFHDIGIMPECRRAFDEAIGQRKEILPIRYMGIGLVWM